MRDPIKTKKNNQRMRDTYFTSRGSAPTVVNMGTSVEIAWRTNITSTLLTSKGMDTPLKNVKSRVITGKNTRTLTRTVAKKRSHKKK